MKAYKAEDLRALTQALFLTDMFDGFLLSEAEFRTYCTFTVDGRTDRGWYTDEELEEQRVEELASYGKLRPVCFGLIKGKRTPGFFRIVMKLSPEDTGKLLKENRPDLSPESAGFYMNFRFEEGTLTCVTAASLNIFPPDRALEEAWDLQVLELFRKRGIAVSVL